jgi:hypothetical protein
MTATRSRHRWIAVQGILIVLAVVVVAAFTFIKPSATSLVQRFTPNTLGDQPTGAVVLGGEDGTLAVGLAVAPRSHGLLVVATVFDPNGRGKTGLNPRITVTGHDGSRSAAAATACTAGCYQAVFADNRMPAHATISFNNGSHLGFTLPAHGPTPQGAAVVKSASAEYKQIHSMITDEILRASPKFVADTTYYAVAPDRLHYVVRRDNETTIIGKRSWTRNYGSTTWKESAQTAPINPIAPYWAPLIQDATVLGSSTVQGRPVWIVSFADPQTPGFFTIWVDKANHRTLQLKMTAAAHFMHHTYHGFNTPISVEPPKTTG